MAIEVLLVQLLVLAFTGALWWIARRDLAARVPPPALPAETADTAELEQLCATLETLVTSLARRLDNVERQLAEPEIAMPTVRGSADEPSSIQPAKTAEAEPESIGFAAPAFEPPSFEPPSFGPRGHLDPRDRAETRNQAAADDPADTVPDPRYAPVYALLEAGISDPVEIARQTGLGRGEVDLILSLRDRRAF